MKPTPQLSCSLRGSYRPWAGGRPELIIRLSFANRDSAHTMLDRRDARGSGTSDAGSHQQMPGRFRGSYGSSSARIAAPAGARSREARSQSFVTGDALAGCALGLDRSRSLLVTSSPISKLQEPGRRGLEAGLPPVNDRQRAGETVARVVGPRSGSRPASPP